MIWIYMLLFLVNQICSAVIGIGIDVDEVQILKKRLFENYDREILPTTNTDQPISVLLSFSLLSVFGVDMKQEVLSTSGMFQISWKDERLTWNKTNHNGFDNFVVPLKSLWKPDVIILNSVYTDKALINDGNDNNYVTINSDGTIKWRVDVNMKTYCRVSMKLYPFETQVCYINLTKSYLDDQSEILRYANISMDRNIHVPSGEWKDITVDTFQQTFPHPEGEISGLQLQIKMKRQGEFYFWNYVMPSISLSIADWFVFVLPVESGEKIKLAIFVFLANAVFIRLFNDSIPPVVEISYFGQLLWANLLLSGIVIVSNIVITACFYRKSLKCISSCCPYFTSSFKCKETCKCKQCKKSCCIKIPTTDDETNNGESVEKRYNTNRNDETSIKKTNDTETDDTYCKSVVGVQDKTNEAKLENIHLNVIKEDNDQAASTSRPLSNKPGHNVERIIRLDPNKEPLVIKHRDVKISMDDSEYTYIKHGGMECKLGKGKSLGFSNKRVTWSDVARNLDIICAVFLFLAYIIMYAYFWVCLEIRNSIM